MKKLLFTTLTALLFTFTGNAQISATLNVGTLFLSDTDSEVFIGFNLEGKYDLNENMRAGLAFGLYNYSEDFDDGGDDMSVGLNIIPISASFEYKILAGNFRPYAGINVGLSRSSASIKVLGDKVTVSDDLFSFAPVVGAEYMISDNFGINLNTKYHYIFSGDNNVDNSTAVAVNLGVVLAF